MTHDDGGPPPGVARGTAHLRVFQPLATFPDAVQARLIAGGFELLDTQYVTEHLKTFGAVEIPRRRYTGLLEKALTGPAANFTRLSIDQPISGTEALAIIAERH